MRKGRVTCERQNTYWHSSRRWLPGIISKSFPYLHGDTKISPATTHPPFSLLPPLSPPSLPITPVGASSLEAIELARKAVALTENRDDLSSAEVNHVKDPLITPSYTPHLMSLYKQ